jgi:hypothetical protein
MKENTGITSSTYACFHHVLRFINNSQANDDNITRSSSNHPLPFVSKQPLHVGQLNHILFYATTFGCTILVSFPFQTHNFAALQKR